MALEIPPIFNSMTQLGPAIYLKDFSETPKKHEKSLTIILLFWMNANHRPTAKYISEYSKIAPNARIISVFTSASNLFLRNSVATENRRLDPVLKILLSAGDDTLSDIHIHAFSNGGCISLNRLAASYRKVTNKPLPAKALIIDSAPGKASYSVTIKALSYSFPRFFLWRIIISAGIYAALFLMGVYRALLRKKDALSVLREELNAPKLLNDKAERCYIYSKEDELIHWKDVEEHVENARSKGLKVSKELFEGSPHVNHMKTNPQRYWKIVSRILKTAEPLGRGKNE